MNITLINPPFIFPVEAEIAPSHCLGLRYISAYLKKSAHRVKFIDALSLGFDNRQAYAGGYIVGLELPDIVSRVPEDTDIVGVSAPFSQLAPVVHELIVSLKSRHPHIPVVMGGVYPSTQPHLALTSQADLIVVGEGERAFRRIADGENPDKIRGVYSHRHGKATIFPPTDMIDDLDCLPFPDDDLPGIDRYFDISPRNDRGQRTASILTSRGCPFQCEFCSIHPVYGRRWRGRSAENVLGEIEYLHKTHGVTALEIEDDNFTMQKQRTAEILEGIIRFNERDYNLSWRTPNGVRIDTIDREIAALIRRSQCREIVIALEHGDQDMLGIMNKQLDLEKAYDAIRLLVEQQIPRITIFVMVGYPGETQTRFLNGIDYLRKVKRLGGAVSAWVNIVQPYPGTPLLTRCRKEGYLTDPSVDNFLEKKHLMSTGYSTPIATPDFDGKEVLRRKSAIEAVFSREEIHLLLCGWFFQGNTGDDLSMTALTGMLSEQGDLKIVSTESFDTGLIDWCDVLIIGSGSHVTPRGISCYRQVKYARERGKKIIYCAQTIEAGHPQFIEHLSRADLITVREAESKRVAESHGFRAILTADPVFEKKRRKIGCSFRRWVSEPPDILDTLAAILDDLAADHDIVFLPFTQNDTDTESDTTFHEKIVGKMRYKPVQADYVETIENIDLLIGMRLHALICAINAGKQVLAVDYDAKIGRIFSDLNLGDQVISYAAIDKLPSLVRGKIFPSDHLAQRARVNEALVARMCTDIRNDPKPAISVVMPAFNRANLLREAIDSLRSQTFSDWELILIDDGSTDETAALVQSYQDDRLRYYNFGHNGISYARNIGNLLSSGEIIAVADSDDVNLPERLAVTMDVLMKSGADVLYASMYHFGDIGERELIPSHPFSSERLQVGNFIYHPTVAYRRAVAMTCPYDEDLEMVEDYDMYRRAADKGFRFVRVEEALVMHRLHGGQISAERAGEMEEIHRTLAMPAAEGARGTYGECQNGERRLIGRLQMAEAELRQEQRRVQELNSLLGQAQAAYRVAAGSLDEVCHSNAWRITHPLRSVGTVLKSAFRRIRVFGGLR